jgi:hypothetical protein
MKTIAQILPIISFFFLFSCANKYNERTSIHENWLSTGDKITLVRKSSGSQSPANVNRGIGFIESKAQWQAEISEDLNGNNSFTAVRQDRKGKELSRADFVFSHKGEFTTLDLTSVYFKETKSGEKYVNLVVYVELSVYNHKNGVYDDVLKYTYQVAELKKGKVREFENGYKSPLFKFTHSADAGIIPYTFRVTVHELKID